MAAFRVFRPWMDGDSTRYLELAQSLATGKYGFFVNGMFSPEANRPPGYPIFLWFFLHALRLPVGLVILLQIGLYLASLWLLTRLLRDWNLPALPFQLLCTLYPFGLGYSAKFMSEGVATFLLTTAVFLSARRQAVSSADAAMTGFLLGCIILVRASFVLVPFAFLAGLAYRCSLCPGWRLLTQRTVVLSLAVAATLLPYSLYNWRHFQTLAPLPPVGSGVILYVGSWEPQLTPDDFQSLYTNHISHRARDSGFVAEINKINAQFGIPADTPPYAAEVYGSADQQIRAAGLLRKLAIENIERNPWGYLRTVLARCWKLWNIAAYPTNIPYPLRMLLKTVAGLVSGLGLAGGIALLIWRRSQLAVGVVLPLLYLPAVHAWLATTGRYTAPARPLLLLSATLVLIEISRVPGLRKKFVRPH